MKSNLAKPVKKHKKTDVVVVVLKKESIESIMIKIISDYQSLSLSLHAKTYDPLGLILPTRMFGNLLFRI